MSRPLRVAIANGVYHVINRGLERRAIVQDDQDRRTWRRLLHRVAVRCGWRVFAYVLGSEAFVNRLRAMVAAEESRSAHPSVPLTMDRIEGVVAEWFGVTPERIRRPGRRSNKARDAAILLARELLCESLASLAGRMGGVGASAISEATRRARLYAESDPAFRDLLERARHVLGV